MSGRDFTYRVRFESQYLGPQRSNTKQGARDVWRNVILYLKGHGVQPAMEVEWDVRDRVYVSHLRWTNIVVIENGAVE